MKALRPFFEWWNESGLLITLLLATGHFSVTALLGMTTLFISFVFGVGAIILAFMLAKAQESGEEFQVETELFPSRFLPYAVLFCLSVAAVIGIGKLI